VSSKDWSLRPRLAICDLTRPAVIHEAKDGAGRVGPGIPKSEFWASAPEGIDQVGCVYTAQGFEFDHVGVIVGPDLVYRPMDGGWVGQREQPHDRGVTDAAGSRPWNASGVPVRS
jgi:hypothetical protein